MKLVKKAKYFYKGEEYFIDIDKIYDIELSHNVYYRYKVKIYKIETKTLPIIKIMYMKNKIINIYETYWLDYFDFHGNLNLVVERAFRKTEDTLDKNRSKECIECNERRGLR